MSSRSKAWMVAASIVAVEALKDQGICRWNYPLRSIAHNAEKRIGSLSQSQKLLNPFPSRVSSADEIRCPVPIRTKEACMDKTMELGCWGPSTTRF